MNMKVKAFRLDEKTIADMEEVRDHRRFPTQSDFVRTAIRRLIGEERHRVTRAQVQRELSRSEAPGHGHAPDD